MDKNTSFKRTLSGKKDKHNQKYNSIIFYIHDPMCSWCWAFRKAWDEIQQLLRGKTPVAYLVGGLAADTDEIMTIPMQEQIQQYWRNIEQRIAETKFNFDFWTQNQPRRSTYPACRATLAARRQKAEKEMILAAINLSWDNNINVGRVRFYCAAIKRNRTSLSVGLRYLAMLDKLTRPTLEIGEGIDNN